MTTRCLEMALTVAEFERQLQPLVDGWSVSKLADGWQLRQAACTVSLHCQPQPARRLGLLELPCVAVELHFAGCSELEQARFVQRFERYFRRGGG